MIHVLLGALLVAVLFLAFLLFTGVNLRGPGSGWDVQIRRTVVVHLAKHSVRGILIATYEDGITLASPEWVTEVQPYSLGGELFVPKEQIRFVQAFDHADDASGS